MITSFSHGGSLTDDLVRKGAPILPAGYTYRLSIAHEQGGPAEVTAKIGHLKRHWDDNSLSYTDVWSERIRYTEVTRVDLSMAAVAAAKHAYEGIIWE